MELRDISTDFGYNAGTLWNILEKNGPLKKGKIIKMTNLKDRDFYCAVGWLARENKIAREKKDLYKLDYTNLTNEIGHNAGKVWQVMNIWGEIDASTIKKLADINDEKFYCALGWLAKEDKLIIDEDSTKYNIK
jgi:hypothetical protein